MTIGGRNNNTCIFVFKKTPFTEKLQNSTKSWTNFYTVNPTSKLLNTVRNFGKELGANMKGFLLAKEKTTSSAQKVTAAMDRNTINSGEGGGESEEDGLIKCFTRRTHD